MEALLRTATVYALCVLKCECGERGVMCVWGITHHQTRNHDIYQEAHEIGSATF